MATERSIDFGPVRLIDTGQVEHITSGQTSKRQTSSGSSRLFLIQSDLDISVRVAYIDWENDDREVRGLPGSTPNRLFSRLARGSRISVSRFQDLEWMELRISTITSMEPRIIWSNPRKIDLLGLNEACGFNVQRGLKELGAQGVGKREDLINTDNNRATDLCVLFSSDDKIVPIAAFAAVRVIPIGRQATKSTVTALGN